MKIIERTLGAISLLAIIMKLFLVPGSGALLIISLGILTMIYNFLGFLVVSNIRLRDVFKKSAYEEVSALRIIGAIGLGMSLSTICVGIMFKIQFWNGSDAMLLLGLSMTFVILLVAVIKFIKNKHDFYKNVFIRTAIIGGLGLVLLLLSDLTIKKFQFRNYPQYLEVCKQMKDNPRDENLRIMEEIEYKRIMMSPEEFERFLKSYPNQTGLE